MKLVSALQIAAMAVLVGGMPAIAAGLPLFPPRGRRKQVGAVWFERALALDTGSEGTPDAARAFDAMRRAPRPATRSPPSTSGSCSTAAAAPRATWLKPRFGMPGRPPPATGAPPSTSDSSMKAARAFPRMADLSRAWYAAADLPAARERLSEARRGPNRPRRDRAPQPLFPTGKALLEPSVQDVDLVWTTGL